MTTDGGAAILSMSGQAWLFLSTVLAGACIGLFYDFFRILRKTATFLAKSTAAVWLEDFLFWVAVTGGMFYFMLNQNFGEIRLFSMIGAAIGAALYFAALSRFVIIIFVNVINYMKKVVATALRIIFFPLRILLNFLSPTFVTLCKKIRSGLCHLLRYVKIRFRKSLRNLFILRKKV